MKRLKLPFIFLLYLFLSCICFYRALLQGRLIASGDALLYFYPLKLYYATSFWHHGFHWWLPYEFLGLPFLGTLQTGILYPLNWFYFFLPAKDIAYGFNWSLIVHYALAGFFTYLYVRLLGLRDIPAFLAGMVFGLSGFMMAHQQTINMQNAGVWLPLLLYFYEKIRRDLKFRDALWAGIAAGVQQLAGHTQICVYTTFVLGLFTLFFIFYQEKGKRFRFLILCALPVILGVLIALPQLFATAQLLFHSYHLIASKYFFSSKGLPPYTLPMLVFPFSFGGGYGGHFPKTTLFVLENSGFTGSLPLVFSVWIFLRNYKVNFQVGFWGIAAYFSLFLVFGTYNPLAIPLFHIPPFSLFRIPSRNWFEFDFATAILFAFGIQKLMDEDRERKKNFLQVGLGLILICILGFILLAVKPLLLLKFSFGDPSFFVPIFFACAYLLILFLLYRFQRQQTFILILLCAAVFAEAFSFSAFIGRTGMKISTLNKLPRLPLFHFLKINSGLNRYAVVQQHTFTNTVIFPLANVPARLNLLNGYDPLVSSSFCKLTGIEYMPYGDQWPVLLKNSLLLSLLNVKYLLVPGILKTSILKMKVDPLANQKKEEVLKEDWKSYSAFKTRGIYVLISKGNKGSLLSKKIKIHPEGIYLFSLQVKAPQIPSSNLVLDISENGKNFHIHRRVMWIFPREVSRHFKTFSVFYYIQNKYFGHSNRNEAYIRIYTFSKTPILVKNPQILWFKKYVPIFLGRKRNISHSAESTLLYRKVFQEGRFSIYKNLNSLPRIFSIKRLEEVKSLQEFRKKLFMLEFNPARTAFVYPKILSQIGRSRFSSGKIVITRYGTERIAAKTEFQKTGFVILSDQYYPGWKAFIDGKRVSIYRTDGLLQGVMIPPGSHLLVFRYDPLSIKLLFWIAAAVCILCAAGIGAHFMWIKKS